MWPMVVGYFSVGSTLIVGLLAFLLHKRVHTQTGKGMLRYFYFRLTFEALSLITSMYGNNNMLYFYLYCGLETVIVVHILAGSYYMQQYARYIWAFAFLLIMGVAAEGWYNFESWQHFANGINTFTRFTESLFLLLLSGFTLTRLVRSPHRKMTKKLPEYWLAMGIMFYFSVHTPLAFISNYALHTYLLKQTIYLWVFNSSANIITNLIYLCWLRLIYRSTT